MGDRWLGRAACRGADPSVFFPHRPTGNVTDEERAARDEDPEHNLGVEAKRVCARCPVLRECLEDAIERREEHGIWGGAGENWRRQLARAYRAGPETWEPALAEHVARLDQLTASEENYGSVVAIDTNGPGATHGLASTYARGCRCRPCKYAVKERPRRTA